MGNSSCHPVTRAVTRAGFLPTFRQPIVIGGSVLGRLSISSRRIPLSRLQTTVRTVRVVVAPQPTRRERGLGVITDPCAAFPDSTLAAGAGRVKPCRPDARAAQAASVLPMHTLRRAPTAPACATPGGCACQRSSHWHGMRSAKSSRIPRRSSQKQRALRLFTIAEADDADVKRELACINKLHGQARARLADMEGRRAVSAQFEPVAEKVRQFCELMRDRLNELSFEQKARSPGSASGAVHARERRPVEGLF